MTPDGRKDETGPVQVEVHDLAVGYGEQVVQRELTFSVRRGEIFAVMGGSGCGKSTLMRSLIGLKPPSAGRILYEGEDFWAADRDRRQAMTRNMGVLYQAGALWSSMTLAENVGLPLESYTGLSRDDIRDVVSVKLALVGLRGFEDRMPSELSGGMRKRAALARAMAMDPAILFFDEPSAGLDPVSARRLDDLILQVRESLGTTIVVVSHDLDSIFAISGNAIFLDTESKTMIAQGNPRELREHAEDERVLRFLNRGEDPTSRGGEEGQ